MPAKYGLEAIVTQIDGRNSPPRDFFDSEGAAGSDQAETGRGTPDRLSANAVSRQIYFDFIRNHPQVFARLTLQAWSKFITGTPAHFRYDFMTDQQLYRDENGFRLHGMGSASNTRLLEGLRNGLKMDISPRRNHTRFEGINASSLIRYSADKLFFVNLIIQPVWFVLTAFSFLFNRVKGWYVPTILSRINLGVLYLNGCFLGLGLGTVLLHPPLGRYILPLAPLVLVAALSASISCYLLIKASYKNGLGHCKNNY